MLTKTDIEQYFMAEKNAGLFFIIAGIAAVIISIAFFIFSKTNLYKGMAWPLIILGLIQAIVGYTIYSKSDQQRIDNVYAYDMNPAKLKATELPRMQKAVKGITIFLWIELITFLTGIILLFANRHFTDINSSSPSTSFWLGVGIALIIQALLLSAADFMAYKRGKDYTYKLENFLRK